LVVVSDTASIVTPGGIAALDLLPGRCRWIDHTYDAMLVQVV